MPLAKNNIIDSTIINVQGGILWRTKTLALLLDCWKMQKKNLNGMGLKNPL